MSDSFDACTSIRLLFILLFSLLFCCESDQSDRASGNSAMAYRTSDGTVLTRPDLQQADSLLRLMKESIRRRNSLSLDSLIAAADSLFNNGDDIANSDSLLQVKYFSYRAHNAGFRCEIGDFAEYQKIYQKAFPGARKLLGDQHPILALFYNVKSAFFLLQGSLDSSKVYAAKAIRILDRQADPDKNALVSAHMRLARAGFENFDFSGGMDHANKAIQYAREARGGSVDSVALGAAYNLRAGVHYTLQEYQETVEDLQRASRMNSGSAFWEAIYTINIAGVLGEVGNSREALALNRKAEKLLGNIGRPTPHYSSIVDYNFGILYMDLAVYDSAALYFEKMLDWRKKNTPQQHTLIATNQNSLGYVYTNQKRLAEAKKMFDQSRRIYQKMLSPFHPEWNRYNLLLSGYYETAGQLNKALETAQLALNSSLQKPDFHPVTYNPPESKILLKAHALKAFVRKARLQLALHQKSASDAWLEQSLETVTAAIELIDRMRADYQVTRFRRLLNEQARSIYASGIEAALARYNRRGDPGDLRRAFEFSTLSKGGKLRDLQREHSAKRYSAIPDSLQEKEAALQTRIWRNEVSYNLLQSGGSPLQDLRKKAIEDTLRNLWVRLGEFRRHLREQNPEYRHRMYQRTDFSAKQFQKNVLAGGSVVLDVFSGNDRMHFFYVSEDTIAVVSIDNTAAFESILDRLQQSMSGSAIDYAGFCDNAHALYQKVLQPVEKIIAEQQIIFIPDKALYNIPFAALLTEPVTASALKSYAELPYLIRRNPLRYSYSASLLMSENDNIAAKPPQHQFIGFAPGFREQGTIIQGDLLAATDSAAGTESLPGALPFSESEVNEIRDCFLVSNSNMPLWLQRLIDRSTRLKLNREASESGLFNEALEQYRYVHFSTHGFFYEKPVPLAGLLLYPDERNDGRIFPGDIYRLKLNADLVVLSACQTGLGEWARGEGLIGPAQAFLQAGAKNLLVTLWQTENRSARDIMLRFYREILSGAAKVEALQAAQLSMLETEDFQHPRYWAAYILIGQ